MSAASVRKRATEPVFIGRPVDLARLGLRRRRVRDAMFPAGLFADPAWDMLLDLFVAREEGRTVSVSNVCLASAAPPATALRYLRRLEGHYLIRRIRDQKDARRVYVELTDLAHRNVWHVLTSET